MAAMLSTYSLAVCHIGLACRRCHCLGWTLRCLQPLQQLQPQLPAQWQPAETLQACCLQVQLTALPMSSCCLEQNTAALAAAVTVEQLDQLPVNSNAGAAGRSVNAGDAPASAGASPVLRFKLRFAPQKAMSSLLQLAVTCSSGSRWVYDLQLVVSAPLS